MASYIEKNFICPLCDKEFSANILQGFYHSGYTELDGNLHQTAIYERIIMCPDCGYAANVNNFNNRKNNKDILYLSEYQDIFNNPRLEKTLKKILLAALYSEKLKDFYASGNEYLMAAWYLRDKQEQWQLAMQQAINVWSVYLANNPDVKTALVLIDCLRQIGNLSEAAETVDSLAAYVDEPYYQQILNFQRKLIEAKDTAPHSMVEVTV